MANKEILYDGYRTRYRRIIMDYTVKELAIIVGVSQMEIQSIETGKTNPSIDICRRIADALACSIESLFGYVDEEPISPYYYYYEVRDIIYKETISEKIKNYIKKNSKDNIAEIAKALNISKATVYKYKRKRK